MDAVKKTTDGGYNWIDLPSLPIVPQFDKNGKILTQPDVTKITFINKDTGWVTNGSKSIFKTTNGGLNWTAQNLKLSNSISVSAHSFNAANKNVLYSDAASITFPNSHTFGIVFKTTNGGTNWGYQLPDTTTPPFFGYLSPEFIDINTGWFGNIHTTNGGGPIIYTEVLNISVGNPEEYLLYQNYPNPFNPSTVIEFYLPKKSNIELKVYDVTGKTVLRIIDNFQLQQGYHSYRIDDFNSLGLSNGIYFYRLIVNSNKILTKKMIFLK